MPQNAAPVAAQAVNDTRHEARHLAGRFRSGKLAPIMAHAMIGREAGLLHQSISFELDPVAGRMISQTFAEVACVYVPVQAVDALLNDDDENAGITEILRRKLMDKEVLFPLEAEGELTKRMGINPRSVAGVKSVSSIARIAHNAAVNHLRKRRYIYADLVDADNATVTPAIIGSTVLDRFNGALDPDEHINGNVQLALSEGSAPVRGITQGSNANIAGAFGDTSGIAATATGITLKYDAGGYKDAVIFKRKQGNPAGTQLDIYADLEEIAAGGFSLTDLYNAQKADRLVRAMRQIANANPEDGEDAVLRWVFGLSADSARHPFVLYEDKIAFGEQRRAATDAVGMLDETQLTYQVNRVDFTVPVPATELGGVIITFATVKPDEVIDSQPHPMLTDNWTSLNHVAQQMRVDPEPVTYRDLFSDITTPADETGVKFYTGANELKRSYVHYGFNRQVDPDTVESKTVLWQYAVPAGVTPDNILYPENLPQYPFLDQNAEVCTYAVQSQLTVKTPIFFGPTPVEKVAIVDSAGVLE